MPHHAAGLDMVFRRVPWPLFQSALPSPSPTNPPRCVHLVVDTDKRPADGHQGTLERVDVDHGGSARRNVVDPSNVNELLSSRRSRVGQLSSDRLGFVLGERVERFGPDVSSRARRGRVWRSCGRPALH